MVWEKQGHIYVPNGDQWWAREYTNLPTILIQKDAVRVYFASLDENKYGRIGYVNLNPDNLSEITYIHPEPSLDLGELGCFDDSGVNPSTLLTINNELYLYYVGWQRCERVPYVLQAGLAKSTDDGQSFERVTKATILPRTDDEPLFRSAMTVIKTDDNYQAWYPSAIRWSIIHGTYYPVYIIRRAVSKDGIHWHSTPEVNVNFQSDDEFGLGRPYVTYENGLYQMWYSVRSRTQPYRMGYATSQDGIHWQRKDQEVGISASDSGWDSEMVCYGTVHYINGEKVMFYNGNRHGQSGFGYAIWRE